MRLVPLSLLKEISMTEDITDREAFMKGIKPSAADLSKMISFGLVYFAAAYGGAVWLKYLDGEIQAEPNYAWFIPMMVSLAWFVFILYKNTLLTGKLKIMNDRSRKSP